MPPGQRLVAHALVRFAIPKTKYIFEPSFLMQSQGVHQELNAGCLFMYELGSPTHYTGYLRRSTIGLGGFYRRGGGVAILLQFGVNEQYAIGISYDVNYSGLSGVSRKRGGMELSLRYSPNKSFLYGQQ